MSSYDDVDRFGPEAPQRKLGEYPKKTQLDLSERRLHVCLLLPNFLPDLLDVRARCAGYGVSWLPQNRPVADFETRFVSQ